MNVNPFSYLMNKISQKVSKSGDTMSGRLLINRPSSSTAVSWSELEMGNDTAEGTVGNSAGRLVLLGKGTKYTILDAPNSTANRTIDLPDKGGTVALTSDLGGVSHELKKSNASGVLTYQLSLYTIHVMEFSNATYHILVNDAYFYHADKKIGGDTLTLSYDNDTGIVTISGARADTNVHIAKWSIG